MDIRLRVRFNLRQSKAGAQLVALAWRAWFVEFKLMPHARCKALASSGKLLDRIKAKAH